MKTTCPRIVCLFVLAIILGGCASLPRQAFNKDAYQNLRVIEILKQVDTERYFVHNKGHAGMAFGLAGGLVAAADMEVKASKFTALMIDRNLRAIETFQQALQRDLGNAGYGVRVLDVKRKKNALLETYNWLNGYDVDAYLDFSIAAGYISASIMTDYIPAVHVTARLVKKGSHKVLYQEVIHYGYGLPGKDAASYAADSQYYFKSYGALTGNPDRAMEGLRKGIFIVAEHIARSLAKY
jgi:hypothetical protein